MFRKLAIAAVAATMAWTGASAATFDRLLVESDNNRPGATGDIPNNGVIAVGAIQPGELVGLGGRIVTAMDIWSFSTSTAFTVSFTDLMLGDGNSGFDSTTTAFAPGAPNEIRSARFSLLDAANSDAEIAFTVLSSDQAPGTDIFSGGPGSYKLKIDGSIEPNKDGSTYDIAISAVPVPAALPMLLGALGALAAIRRRA